MKKKSAVLTKEERDILILAALHGQHLNNAQIAQRLGISVSRVKTLIHQACIKLGAHNRNEAIFCAIMKRGEISSGEFYSIDELAEILKSLGPDMTRKIAQLVRQESEHGQLSWEDEPIICTARRRDTILTERERDVLILAGRGLTNTEIANRLYVTNNSVRTFLNQAYSKLGTRKRADAVALALKQREISIDEIFSLEEVIQGLAPLGAESIEKMAQLMSQELGQKPVLTGS